MVCVCVLLFPTCHSHVWNLLLLYVNIKPKPLGVSARVIGNAISVMKHYHFQLRRWTDFWVDIITNSIK